MLRDLGYGKPLSETLSSVLRVSVEELETTALDAQRSRVDET
jgi:hypothetical protein